MVTIRVDDGSREQAHSAEHVRLKGLTAGRRAEWRPKSQAPAPKSEAGTKLRIEGEPLDAPAAKPSRAEKPSKAAKLYRKSVR